jgi:hypothetical protein
MNVDESLKIGVRLILFIMNNKVAQVNGYND